jgi:hypothetical protein
MLPKLENKIERFKRFWQRAPADRPLLGLRLKSYFPMRDFEGGPHSGTLSADQFKAEDYFDDYERLYAMYDQAMGDQIYVASACRGVPWLEAILGCEIKAGSDSMWARPHLNDWAKLDTIRFDPNNPWFVRLLAVTEKVVEYSAGRFPVGMPLLRGPGDVATALRGVDNFCMDVVTEPDRLGALLDVCADTYIQVTRALIQKCTHWGGGYFEQIRHLWAPGYCCQTQADISSLLSPNHYRQLLLPRDARVLNTYDYCFIHLHSSSRHILDDVLSIDPLAAVQISADVGGPGPLELVGDYEKVLARTCLIIQVDGKESSPADIVQLCRRLPSEGFYILVRADSLEEGNRFLQEVSSAMGYTTL